MNNVRRLASPCTPRLNTTGPFSPPTVPAGLPPLPEVGPVPEEPLPEVAPVPEVPPVVLPEVAPVAGVELPLPDEVPDAVEPPAAAEPPEDWLPPEDVVLLGMTGPRLGTTSVSIRLSSDRASRACSVTSRAVRACRS